MREREQEQESANSNANANSNASASEAAKKENLNENMLSPNSCISNMLFLASKTLFASLLYFSPRFATQTFQAPTWSHSQVGAIPLHHNNDNNHRLGAKHKELSTTRRFVCHCIVHTSAPSLPSSLFSLLSSLISLISRLYLAASFRASPSHSGDEQTWPFLASSKRELLQQARKCAMFPFCYPVPLFPFLWLEFVWQFLAPEASPPTNTNSRLLLHKGSKESQNDIYKDKLDEQTKTSSSSRERNAKTCLASPPTQTHNQ